MGMGKIKTEHWSNQFGRDQLEATLRISEDAIKFLCMFTYQIRGGANNIPCYIANHIFNKMAARGRN